MLCHLLPPVATGAPPLISQIALVLSNIIHMIIRYIRPSPDFSTKAYNEICNWR